MLNDGGGRTPSVGLVGIYDGDRCVRQKVVCSVVEHGGGEILHDWLCLHMQIANHGIAMPSSKDSYQIEVHFPTKERHGTSRAKTASTYLMGLDASAMDVGRHC
jgi:hypothetical protein